MKGTWDLCPDLYMQNYPLLFTECPKIYTVSINLSFSAQAKGQGSTASSTHSGSDL